MRRIVVQRSVLDCTNVSMSSDHEFMALLVKCYCQAIASL